MSSLRHGLSGDLPAARPAAAGVAGLHVLAAEDNLLNQLVLKGMLEQAGIEPLMVGNGAEALAAWRNGAWDVVLMDIQMPIMDGTEAARAIRAAEAAEGRAYTPIVALTANTMAHQMTEYRAAGMDAFVGKPIEVDLLLEVIETCAGRAARRLG